MGKSLKLGGGLKIIPKRIAAIERFPIRYPLNVQI